MTVRQLLELFEVDPNCNDEHGQAPPWWSSGGHLSLADLEALGAQLSQCCWHCSVQDLSVIPYLFIQEVLDVRELSSSKSD